MIVLDEATHVYSNPETKEEYPSVTTILKDAGHIDTRWFTPEGRDRGTDVHKASEDIDNRVKTVLSFIGDPIKPYLDAYIQFRHDSTYIVEAVEELVYHAQYGYAGMLDRRLIMNEKETLVDLKTSATCSFWHGLQLAAYELVFGRKMEKRILLLKKTGKYSLVDNWKGISFNNPMWTEYWKAIALKSKYDRMYLK